MFTDVYGNLTNLTLLLKEEKRYRLGKYIYKKKKKNGLALSFLCRLKILYFKNLFF